MSDVDITKRCGLIELLEVGDQIMADKGFVLNNVLKDTGVSIATPHFLCSDGQFTTSQIDDNQKIASLRIHVERHIKRVKEYKLFTVNSALVNRRISEPVVDCGKPSHLVQKAINKAEEIKLVFHNFVIRA
jgi:hypothetical protein